MANVLPPVDTVGVWKVKLPYTVKAQLPYWLIAIRMFEDVTRLGMDVYKTYYEPYIKDGDLIPGTSETFSFQAEIDNGARILTIKSEAGETLYIPSTFVEEYPDTNIVIYRPMIVSLFMGIFREDMDYSILLQALEETVKNYTGVDDVQCAVHAGPSTSGLSTFDMEALELARENKLALTETNIEKVIRLEAELNQMRGTLKQCTAILKANGLIN